MNTTTPAREARKGQAERRLDGLSRLLETTHLLATQIDEHEILETIIRQACRALDCERASLYRFDERRRELVTAAATDTTLDHVRRSVDTGITGFVARERVVVNVPDPAQDSRWDPVHSVRAGLLTRNILAVPLKSASSDDLLGVLALFNNYGGPFDQDDEEFAIAFGQHAAAALERTRLVAALEQQKELEASLLIAREVQERFMPQKLPSISGYEAGAWWLPNQHVGGDYCDLFALPNGTFGLCVADVSGHGLGPSLLMASVRASLRTLLLEHDRAADLLELLGRAIHDDLQHGAFVTMILGMLDPRTHQLEYSNAGHGPAFVYSPSKRTVHSLDATGVPLGVIEAPSYPSAPAVCLEAGDLVVLCTDGIVEAMDDRGAQFGLERLEALAAELAHEPINTIPLRIGESVAQHYIGETPPDDLTVLVVRRNK
jgi:serine phosphatase RsbU (regulator of sigma subunit)